MHSRQKRAPTVDVCLCRHVLFVFSGAFSQLDEKLKEAAPFNWGFFSQVGKIPRTRFETCIGGRVSVPVGLEVPVQTSNCEFVELLQRPSDTAQLVPCSKLLGS